MPGDTSFALHFWDYFAFVAFFVVLSAVGYWAGRKERAGAPSISWPASDCPGTWSAARSSPRTSAPNTSSA